MTPVPFIAASAEEALAQIRAKLGPEAIVLNVRPLPAHGLSRLWHRPMIEVLAHLPEAAAPAEEPVSEALAEFREQLRELRHHVELRANRDDSAGLPEPPEIPDTGLPLEDVELNSGQWRVGAVLQKSGLLPLHVQFILDRLRAQHGEIPPRSLGEEITLARELLAGMWRGPRPLEPHSVHLLVGPAGAGKSTCLCKWLARASLLESRLTRVWRLDGSTANMAEALSVYCEILGVPNERTWHPGAAAITEDIAFIDLPGTDWRNPIAVKELAGQIKNFGQPHVHLVLNGAYDVANLLAQVRAFAVLPIEDIIVTHLDEECHWGKIWNLALGTNYSLRHFSTGQNIPGDFCDASAETIFAHQFPRK